MHHAPQSARAASSLLRAGAFAQITGIQQNDSHHVFFKYVSAGNQQFQNVTGCSYFCPVISVKDICAAFG